MKQRKSQMQLLDEAILLLETRKKQDLEDLKTQFHQTSNSFKPINIFHQTIKDFKELPEIKTNIFEAIISISGGYLTKKLLVGKSHSFVKRALGYILQYAVTNFISKKVNSENE